ncbi:ABC transporter substrate-binding protein [Ramlibacter sp.]|uniref:ABC transporter substrate-binding protein n=1 Tax=Ramlibacter sp. TaxID=1917967 RepID=UPI0017E11147|nr:ABC transporter substrate-binding protein [Ramlibacter sp.]MBA2672706.1 ABC transporter substrate-binding protein [Ramlibacter sp.]
MKSTKQPRGLLWAAAAFAITAVAGGAHAAEERVVKITGYGSKTGVLRQFGINSEAAMRASAEQINKAGGVKLADGTRARIAVDYYDDRCNVEEGLAVTRRIASSDALAAIGTTCSSVLESIFGALQKKAGDPNDAGLQLPIFTDVAMKIGLTKPSEWAFRNIPDEIGMYTKLFAWVRTNHPAVKTVYGGVEEDFVHSRQTWYSVMKERAAAAGYDMKGEAKWLVDDSNFAGQVRQMKEVNADVVVISAHPYTACGVLKEMSRQGVKPKLLVGLTSIATPETLDTCGKEAEGVLIPTSFAPVTPAAQAAAAATKAYGGYSDLHSMAAWENMLALKKVIETSGVQARPDTVKADRIKIRDGLAAMQQTEGLLGPLQRTKDREAVKPYVFVEANAGNWRVVNRPAD